MKDINKVAIYIFLTAFLFGTMEVALKLAGGGMDGFQLTFLRFFIGGLLLLPFALKDIKKQEIKLKKEDYLYLLYVGIICIPVSMLSFQFGVMYTNASTASVIMSLNPIFTMIFAHFMTDEKFNNNKLAVLCIGMIGLFFMVRPWDIQDGNTPVGIILMIIAASTFGLYTVAGKKSVARVGIMAQTSISFIFGSLVLLVIILIMGRPVFDGLWENIGIVMYVSIFVTGLGYYFYFAAIRLSDAATGSIAFFIKPAIAPVIAVIVLGDNILWNTYAGIFIILFASFLNLKYKKEEMKHEK